MRVMGAAGGEDGVRLWGELDGTGSGFGFQVHVVPQRNGYVIDKLTFEPVGELPPGGINSSVLRSLKMGPIDAALQRGQFANGLVHEAASDAARLFLNLPPHATDIEDSRRPTRSRRRDLTELAEWARRAVEALAVEPRKPNVELARRWGITQTQARDTVLRCREKGLLRDGRQGRPGGALTPLAAELLHQPQTKAKTGEEPQ